MNHFFLLTLTLFLTACGGSSPISLPNEQRIGSLPSSIIEPADNQSSPEKIELGRMLFWDPILSGDQDVACVSCHHPDSGYAENLDLSIGVGGHGLSANRSGGVLIKRNAPTVINTAYNGIDENGHYDPSNTAMFWDNRAQSLEEQALGPILSGEEMRGEHIAEADIINEVVNRLSMNAEYVSLFTQAFGDSTINGDRIAKAIAAFERSLVSFNSPFDRYARGDNSALSQEQVRGLNAFIAAGCTGCHNGPMLSDFKLHELPIKDNQKLLDANIEDSGSSKKFRTPSLRNVELTAPYMHNGTEKSLIDAIVFYDNMPNPGNSPEIAALEFEDEESTTVRAIAAFLRSLTDESFDKTIPQSVPSGLNPGGNIH